MKSMLIVLAAVGLCAPALAQEAKKPGAPAPKPEKPAEKAGQPPAMDAEVLAAIMPNENHKRLEPFVGAWNVDVTSQMAPGQPPEHSTGESVQRWVLDGRFILQEHTGSMMNMPFKGLGLWGYDNVDKQYVGIWGDTMGTGLMQSTGQYDDKTKSWTMLGSFKDPSGTVIKTREVITLVSNDKHTFDFYMPGPDGKDVKAMTIVYTRKEMPKFEVKPIEIKPAKPPAATPAETPRK
jgi:hypothetical protein